VAGGGWRQEGEAWQQDVFAYHLSISCNHCERAICLEGCPTRAIGRRDDGVVLIDQSLCVGCGYCSWVCPYSSPQYDAKAGVMSKCTLCHEDLDQGLEPACVAACPVRALDAGPAAELAEKHGSVEKAAEIPPLPAASLTEPALQLAPHAQAGRSAEPDVELTPRPPRGLREWSLVVFTLLSQMAVGVVLLAVVARIAGVARDQVLMPLATCLLAAALVVSGLHLGKPLRALGSLANLGKSWLSREILLAMVLLGVLVLAWYPGWPAVRWLTVPAGLAFLAGMAGVYRQRTVPVWNSWRTPVEFLRSAVMLGVPGGLCVLVLAGSLDTVHIMLKVIIVVLFLLEVAVQLQRRRQYYDRYERLGV
jgi:anaerobic dimethyl sulfoxide reductase subunit B (iron-sulfur subunit)